jgi:mannose-6-phosphate isomerase-like protein (cupin superfamily)
VVTVTTYRVPFDDLPWQTSPAGVLFKAHTFGASRLRLIEITPALAHPLWCVAGHVGYVLEGDVEIEFDGRVERYRAGDGVVIPAGEADRHRPRALSARVRFVFVEAVDPKQP